MPPRELQQLCGKYVNAFAECLLEIGDHADSPAGQHLVGDSGPSLLWSRDRMSPLCDCPADTQAVATASCCGHRACPAVSWLPEAVWQVHVGS